MKVSHSIKISSYFLFLILPFYDVFVPFFTRFTMSLFYIVGPIRYEVMFTFIFLSIILALQKGRVIKRFYFIFPLIFLLLCVFSLLLSSNDITLKLDAVKLQLIIFIYCFFLALVSKENVFLNLAVLKRIFNFQLLLVLFFGVVEYFNQSILTIIYNMPLDEIQHISYFSAQRLISLIGNPINLGAFVVVSLAFKSSWFIASGDNLKKCILILVCTFVVFFTLSRLSIIVFLLILSFIFYNKNLVLFLCLSFFIIIFLFFSLSYVDVNLDYMSRMLSIFNVSTYEENTRVLNWFSAFDRMDSLFLILFGLGFGSSNPSKEYMENLGSIIVENTFTSIFIDLGLFGLLIYLCIFLRFFFLSFRFYRSSGDLSLLAFLLTFLCFSMGNDFHRNMPFSFYFWYFYFYIEVSDYHRTRGQIMKNPIR
ncbi:O-antigen ligase family protein [Moritella dasanensis]|uniref:O-antigen ligase family protein n=1 Tax=Moritella dasanensis TaxID=428031 RepID=UPI0002D5F299|nr:O-antigen ligase family protein [Moritella dasanensis]